MQFYNASLPVLMAGGMLLPPITQTLALTHTAVFQNSSCNACSKSKGHKFLPEKYGLELSPNERERDQTLQPYKAIVLSVLQF